LEAECKELNRRFFTFHTAHRPFILLKWAQTANGKIAAFNGGRLLISNDFTNRLVHKWRSEEAAILVGTNTVFADNPSLTNRLWTGRNPVRMVVDTELKLPANSIVFDQQQKTIVFNLLKHKEENNLLYYQVTGDANIVHQILNAAYQNNIQSILVEGGAKLLQSFIDVGAWDEARIITNEKLHAEGLSAPHLSNGKLIDSNHIFNDRVDFFKRIY
jgi:diaminohydroxyphosphoribosylaminopyrimidine deaminase/5-amino-6-(5-phosphoribosylamino)uracil reductase